MIHPSSRHRDCLQSPLFIKVEDQPLLKSRITIMNEIKIREQMVDSLKEWGLLDDSTFKTNVINTAIEKSKYKEDNPINFDSLKKNTFPKNLKDAFEHVLRYEILPSPLYQCHDKLGMNGYEPFWKKGDRHEKKKTFKKFLKSQLDPLHRFDFHETSEAKELFDRWIVNENDDSRVGALTQAAMTCHALQNTPCFNCKYRNSLRWNRSATASWQFLVCIQCKSFFNVKTKADMEKVEACFKYNDLFAGSFGSFCNIRNSKSPHQKMYLVILPRKPTFNRKKEFVHPVTIAEVDSVIPKARERTFNKKLPSVAIAAAVRVKLKTRANWFDLPEQNKISTYDVAKKVFIERFTEGMFVSLSNAHMGISSATIPPSIEEGSNVEYNQQSSMKNLSKELEQLEIPENWEEEDSD